jgi:hypothetical protein
MASLARYKELLRGVSSTPTQERRYIPRKKRVSTEIKRRIVSLLKLRNVSTMSTTLTITLRNNTTSNTVYAHITGIPLDGSKGPICIMKADGTPYYPSNPPTDMTPISENISIPLAAPFSGSPTQVTIPKLASGRISFSISSPLNFFVNRGPALVQPSITNPSDQNINTLWGFCEFTFDGGLFANISYVDFVALPIAMSLTNESGNTTEVLGMPRNGLATVCDKLRAQSQRDGAAWDQLIYTSPNGEVLRAMSPYMGMVVDGRRFAGYYEPYIDQVWELYKRQFLIIDTQGAAGTLLGRVENDLFVFNGDGGRFAKPNTADVFSCNTGPFGGLGNTTSGNVAARLCASLNRSTLHLNPNQPDGEDVSKYYGFGTQAGGGNVVPTNHYSRIVHETNIDHRGYAFPYDDVVPNAGADQAGIVFDGRPKDFVVTVGGPDRGELKL